MNFRLLERSDPSPSEGCDDALWLGAEAMVSPDCLHALADRERLAATERDVDPSWCVV